MKRFLIPTDFSENSIKVCEYAINTIAKETAELILFHILPDSIMIPDSSFPAGIDSDAFLNSEYLETLKIQSKKNMAELKSKMLDHILKSGIGNITIKTIVTSGDAEWEIMGACKKYSPDIIIMGTRGSGNKGFLEGSMAEKIMTKVIIPVIAVPQDSKSNRPQNILYSTNFNDRDYSKIKLLFTLFKNLDIKIYVSHFDMDGKDASLFDKLENLKQAFYKEKLDNKIFFNIISSTNKKVSLETFCDEYEIDMVSFISYKTNIFKNLFSHEIHK